MTQHRKHRGYASQRIAAEWFAANGFPYAEPVGAGRMGSDITGMPGIDIEVKARRGFDPSAAMRQQSDRAAHGDLAFAILRMDGQGPAVIGSWPVIIRLDAFTELLRAAGYGDQQETTTENGETGNE